ncbi:MAG: hypothetical protein K2N96_10655 [Muribaculaceae bacterium]|nr:hypothetical protein [Muribaculaceae bacterium]
MKIRILLLICILLSACGKAKHGGKSELTALYEELDAEIDKSSEYENIKESRMARLRNADDMTKALAGRHICRCGRVVTCRCRGSP